MIDQFEEVFTQSRDPGERDRFIDTLLEASNCDGERPLHTVVTLRADFYSHCFEHPTLPLESVIADVNIDMVGRNDPGSIGATPSPGELTFPINRALLAGVLLVSDREALDARIRLDAAGAGTKPPLSK